MPTRAAKIPIPATREKTTGALAIPNAPDDRQEGGRRTPQDPGQNSLDRRSILSSRCGSPATSLAVLSSERSRSSPPNPRQDLDGQQVHQAIPARFEACFQGLIFQVLHREVDEALHVRAIQSLPHLMIPLIRASPPLILERTKALAMFVCLATSTGVLSSNISGSTCGKFARRDGGEGAGPMGIFDGSVCYPMCCHAGPHASLL